MSRMPRDGTICRIHTWPVFKGWDKAMESDLDEVIRQRDELLMGMKVLLRVIDNLTVKLLPHQIAQVNPQRNLVADIEGRL